MPGEGHQGKSIIRVSLMYPDISCPFYQNCHKVFGWFYPRFKRETDDLLNLNLRERQIKLWKSRPMIEKLIASRV